MMFAEERKLKILEFIEDKRKATVPQLSELFSVSSATVRNDLRALEKSGLVTRTHGGAMVKGKTGFELDTNERKIRNPEAKRKIARKALELVEDGDTVLLDAGSTTLELARLLPQKKDLTVVTNDLEIGLVLQANNHIRTILIGGLVRNNHHCTVGNLGSEMLQSLSVDKSFMGVNSFTLEKGATTPDLIQAESKKTMISIANKVILLCDHTKFGKNSFIQFASLDSIDILITDLLTDEYKNYLEERDIDLLY